MGLDSKMPIVPSIRVVNDELGFILLYFSFRFLYFILNFFFFYFGQRQRR